MAYGNQEQFRGVGTRSARIQWFVLTRTCVFVFVFGLVLLVCQSHLPRVSHGAEPAGAAPHFVAQTIDPDVAIGYGLAIGEVDGDGHVDILLADKTDIVWYRNPGQPEREWSRHVMAHQLTPQDNVCIAARDLDGDGKVEVAVGAGWNPGETSDPERSGAVFYLQRPADPTTRWKAFPLTPHDPTVHRMHWVRWGENEYRLLVLPLHGRDNRQGEGTPVRILSYIVPLEDPAASRAEPVDHAMHMTHNFDLILRDDAAGDLLWVAGREGIRQLTAERAAIEIPAVEDRGAGEVRQAQAVSDRDLVTIEPMHGFEVVLYTPGDGNAWKRAVLDNSLDAGHALAAADLLGLGRDQIVAGWRNPNAQGRVGIRMYVPNPANQAWETFTIDDNQMACEDLKIADLDADGQPDIIAAGRATNNVIVYWNRSTR